MSTEELKTVVGGILVKTQASGPKDMGKVMGLASKELSGKADGKEIAAIVKAMLG
ncbi:MAG: hypothetical protein EHM20_07735 [Alphaproteobacteria bacterium]|nr:MAG: hypothetical protein EHM20_07735 [Alphaproteobacteria bacterium]